MTSSAGETGAQRRERPQARRAAGFTLLELLVVMSIAGLLLSVVPLAFSGSVELVRSKGAARELAATLQQARARAVAGHRVVDVEFDAAAGHYALGERQGERALPAGVRLTLIDMDRWEDEPGRGRIRFYPDGSSSGGRLSLDDGARRFDIAVHWLLGRVHVRSGEPS